MKAYPSPRRIAPSRARGSSVDLPIPQNDQNPRLDDFPDLSAYSGRERKPRTVGTTIIVVCAGLGLLAALTALVLLINSIIDYKLAGIEQPATDKTASVSLPEPIDQRRSSGAFDEQGKPGKASRLAPDAAPAKQVEPDESNRNLSRALDQIAAPKMPAAVPAVPKDAPVSPPPTKSPPNDVGASPVTASSPAMSAEEVRKLLEQAGILMREGRIASARSLLELALRSNDPAVAFALAETYDPKVIGGYRVVGIQGDKQRAREFYRIARDGGKAEANARLLELDK